MHAVSDTSALSALALIGRLDLLEEQFDGVLCPWAVWNELMNLQDTAAKERLEAAVEKGWILIESSDDLATIGLLARTLDPGEAEAIGLAKASGEGHLLIIDEMAGRSMARSLGIRVVGTLGILLRAKRDGTIQSVGTEMERLESEAGFFMSRSIQEQILKAAGEL